MSNTTTTSYYATARAQAPALVSALTDLGYTAYVAPATEYPHVAAGYYQRPDGTGVCVEVGAEHTETAWYQCMPITHMVLTADPASPSGEGFNYCESDRDAANELWCDTSSELLAAARAHAAPTYEAGVAAANELLVTN